MVNGGVYDDGSIADVPWASVFDPDNNMRAIGEIQARGFRAATDVVDRLIRSAKRPPSGAEDPQQSGQAGERPSVTPEVDRVMELGQQMIGHLAQSLRDAVSQPERVAGIDLVGAAATGRVVLESSADSATATAEVWLHNTGSTDLGKVRMRCGDLLSHDGAVIEAAAVRFEPDAVPMPGRCSRGIIVEVDLPDAVSAGRYHGTLLADGHPDVWLPIELVIGSPAT